MTARSRKRRAMDEARLAGDRAAQSRIFRWSPGGRMPHHKHLDAARSRARELGHMLGRRFAQGKAADGNPDPDTYGITCQFCGRFVVVCRDDESEISPRTWKASGTAIDGRPCPGPGGHGMEV